MYEFDELGRLRHGRAQVETLASDVLVAPRREIHERVDVEKHASIIAIDQLDPIICDPR
jgi:hypothetical protein